MSFFPAILGLIFKLYRVHLKTLTEIGLFNLSNAKCTRISNYFQALRGCNQQG